MAYLQVCQSSIFTKPVRHRELRLEKHENTDLMLRIIRLIPFLTQRNPDNVSEQPLTPNSH
jgi:hypothetical protein